MTDTGEVDCVFADRSLDDFWTGTSAAGPTQMAIGIAGLGAVEEAAGNVTEPLIADDGSITFDSNIFVFVLGTA